MPRPVVPIFFAASRARSSATWYGRISGQASEMMSRATTLRTPACSSSSISASSASGESTTPLPMKQSTVVAQDPRGNQVQHRLLAADHQRVAGVVAALEAHHALRAVGQPVDDLALALVAPLGADDDDVARLARHLRVFFFETPFKLEMLLRSIENPVAARGRPKALPTSS